LAAVAAAAATTLGVVEVLAVCCQGLLPWRLAHIRYGWALAVSAGLLQAVNMQGAIAAETHEHWD